MASCHVSGAPPHTTPLRAPVWRRRWRRLRRRRRPAARGWPRPTQAASRPRLMRRPARVQAVPLLPSAAAAQPRRPPSLTPARAATASTGAWLCAAAWRLARFFRGRLQRSDLPPPALLSLRSLLRRRASVASLTSLGVRGLPPPQDAALALEALARARALSQVSLSLCCADAGVLPPASRRARSRRWSRSRRCCRSAAPRAPSCRRAPLSRWPCLRSRSPFCTYL